MAEAFGVAASAAGIVSLGLEVFKGIISYVDAVQSRTGELDAISRQIKEFNNSLEVIKDVSTHPATNHQLAGVKVQAALASGKQDLEDLKSFLSKLVDDPTQLDGFKSKLKQAKKKMIFPFHQESLDKLQQRLQRANASLGLAIQVLHLEMAGCMANGMSLLEPKLLNAVEEASTTLHEKLGKTLDGNEILTSMMTTLTIDTTANTTHLLHMSSGFSNMSDRVAERDERVYNLLLELAREQQTIKRLVAKPSQLRDTCNTYLDIAEAEHDFTIEDRKAPSDSVEKAMLTGQTVARKGFASDCICRQYQRTLRKQARFAGLVFVRMESISQKHLPECKYAKYETIHKSKSISILYSGLRGLLSRAIDVSVCLTTGAGGISISPNITLQLMVDEKQSPIFRITELMEDCMRGFINLEVDQLILLRVLETGVHRILEQYASKRRSPYEVDCNGQSALHRWTEILVGLDDPIWRIWSECTDKATFTMLTRHLLEAGLSSSHSDVNGVVPGIHLIKGNVHIVFDWTEIMFLLCEESPEPSAYKKCNVSRFHISSPGTLSGATLRGLRTTVQAAAALGCGILSAAILARDEDHVKKIIAHHPSTLREINLLGQTPFHLAADVPEILRLLMDAGGSPDLDKVDEDGQYALDYALRLSHELCSSNNTWEACSNCACTECVKIFLASGWRCKPDFLSYFPQSGPGQVSYAAKLHMLKGIASAGATLKALGLRFLSDIEIDRYHLKAHSVLDHYAPKVAQLLSENGVSLPTALCAIMLEPIQWKQGMVSDCSPFRQDRTSWSGRSGFLRYSSVYHATDPFQPSEPTNRLPQLLYDLGFHDIDQIDNFGHTALTRFLQTQFSEIRPSYILWLIEHGASLQQRLPEGTATAAHLVLQCRLDRLKGVTGRAASWVELQQQEVDAYRQLVSMVAPLNLFDECTCGCIESGCHTFKTLFENIWDVSGYEFRRNDEDDELPGSLLVPNFAERVSKLLQNFPLDISPWPRLSKLGLRYFAFEMLGLRHTCCELRSFMSYRITCRLTSEEVEEIQDEECEKLGVLEQLVEDFNIQYDEFENKDKEGDKFTNFLTSHWAAKMQDVLADSEARELTARERREAEEVGVRWDISPKEIVEEPIKDFEYWMKKLDEIAPAQHFPGSFEGSKSFNVLDGP